MTEIDLPWPPSANTYYRHVGPRVLISAKGRRYRNTVIKLVGGKGIDFGAEDIRVEIDAFAPDRRWRDSDNIEKAVFDSMEKAKLFKNDRQIREHETKMKVVIPGGALIIRIYNLEAYHAAKSKNNFNKR